MPLGGLGVTELLVLLILLAPVLVILGVPFVILIVKLNRITAKLDEIAKDVSGGLKGGM